MDKRGRCISGVFCDDIRHEVNGKTSLIGCYGPIIEVSELPAILPKLGIHVRVETPASLGWGDKVTLKVLRDDEVLMEGVITPSPESDAAEPAPVVKGDARAMAIVNFMLSPIQIEASCALRVRAYFGDEEIRGLGVRIRLNEVLSEQEP